MTDMIERVARAIVQADEQNGGPPWDYYESNKHVMQCRMDRARAAIEAHEKALAEAGLVIVPREPTREMYRAANDTDDGTLWGETGSVGELRLMWAAMISAAPKEGA